MIEVVVQFFHVSFEMYLMIGGLDCKIIAVAALFAFELCSKKWQKANNGCLPGFLGLALDVCFFISVFWKDASLHGTALLFISEKPMAAAQRSSNGCMGSCSTVSLSLTDQTERNTKAIYPRGIETKV